MVVWIMFMIPALAALSCPPTLPLPESYGWLIMKQSCCPLICVCVCHVFGSKPPSVMVNHLRQSKWSTRSLCPLALPRQCQCWIHRLPGESKARAGKTLLRSPLPLPPAAHGDRACMGGPVWDCLLLIELLTQPLALGDTSVSLPMINPNFIHRPRLLPDLVRPRSMCWDIHNKRARRGKGKGWAEGQGKIWWWWQNKSTH